MRLENIVPWGRNFDEYTKMFLLEENEKDLKFLSCADGPASFNYEARKKGFDVVSLDPIYQFDKEEIKKRINESKIEVSSEVEKNHKNFLWNSFKNIDDLLEKRLASMKLFLEDFEENKQNYIYKELPALGLEENSYDIVLCSHFLFLYSKQLNFDFHLNSILELIKVSKKELRIFPIKDLENNKSIHIDKILKVLEEKGYKTEIKKSDYEFQKDVNEFLSIKK